MNLKTNDYELSLIKMSSTDQNTKPTKTVNELCTGDKCLVEKPSYKDLISIVKKSPNDIEGNEKRKEAMDKIKKYY